MQDIDVPLRPAKKPTRVVNPDANRRNILEVAMHEFAEHGLAGARVDQIAAQTDCSKRLIYYHFVDKEGLYLAVLEEAYRKVRTAEAGFHFDDRDPVEALRSLVGFRFDHHLRNVDFVRLVMIENIHHAAFLKRSPAIKALNASAISVVENIYKRGVRKRVFRSGLRAADIHWQISAFSFYNVSNRATFALLFDGDLDSAPTVERLRANAVESILRFVAA